MPAQARLKKEHLLSEIIDRPALERALEAIAAEHPAGPGRHAAIVALLKETLARRRELARQWLNEDGQGRLCAERLSFLMDEVIRALHHFTVTHVFPLTNPSAGERLAVIAVGGYGRGTLAPGSDIDLLFLLPYKQTAWGESVVESMLYVLWDLGLKVGHATRGLDECIRLARADITIRTAVLEARPICGDADLAETLAQRFDKEVVQGTAQEFATAKLAERDERYRRIGTSRYVVEPNVKEGKGGLRDLNTLFWIGKYVYRVHEVEDLVPAGLFTADELRLFLKCEDFLWAVRCHLHFITGRAEERLSFDVQRAIAQALGYQAHPGMQDVERFMKHYFLMAKSVGDLTAIVCAALEERQAKPQPKLNRLLGRFRRRKRPRALPGLADFIIDNGRLSVRDDEAFARDPVNLIRFFHTADQNDLALHPDVQHLITRSLKLINADLRENEEANRLFLEIVSSRHSPEVILRRMNETGVLGRFIPDFGKIVAMMQFNMYHHYTVDEHLIRAVGVLAAMERGQLDDEHPLSAEILPEVMEKYRLPLYVAVLLHDIAKGRPEDHSIAGARIARRLCRRLGLSAADTELVAWLIEHHLLMSNTAQSRDLSDRKTIEGFAAVVQSMDRLKLLMLLTIADIKAVGPGVWTGWKGQLLRTLYWETELLMAGGQSNARRAERVAAAQQETREALTGWEADEIEAYLARHYPPYWLKTDADRRLDHARLLRQAAQEGTTLATSYTTDAFRSITELTVMAQDHPRLLSIIAGACAVQGANIVDAYINTTTDGMALDTIFFDRAFENDEDESRRAERIAQVIERALRGEFWLTDAMDKRSDARSRRSRAFSVEPEVVVTNDWSDRYTLIEVSGLDRPGLLYELTNELSKLNLNIGSAHIATFGEKAVDAFYVTDLVGHKITSQSRQATIRRNLLRVFRPEPAEAARPAKRVAGAR